MRDSRVPALAPKDILVLSYYDEECRILSDLLRKLGHAEVSVRSVDSSQGPERPVVRLADASNDISAIRHRSAAPRGVMIPPERRVPWAILHIFSFVVLLPHLLQ